LFGACNDIISWSEERPFFVFVTIFGYIFAVWGIWKGFVYLLLCQAMVAVELEAGANESTLRKSSVVTSSKGVIEGFRYSVLYSSWVSTKIKCGYTTESEFAGHLLSLERQRRSVSIGECVGDLFLQYLFQCTYLETNHTSLFTEKNQQLQRQV